MIGGDLLDINFQQTQARNEQSLLHEADIFGTAYLGDFATIR
jgi:hypothetical protein